MKLVSRSQFVAILCCLLLIGTATAQVSKETLDSITTPDKVETSIGALNFLDGAPYPETAEKVYDELDRMRGVEAYLKGMPLASIYGLVEGAHSQGAVEAHQVILFEQMLDAQPIYLTGNTSTFYVLKELDLERDGATVIELPAGLLGAINNAWFRYLADFGPFGEDKGQGGKYVILPPGYEGEIPEGHFVVQSDSYNHWIFLRASTADGVDKAVNLVKDNLRIYPLAKADNPPAMEFINRSGKSFNTVHANDFTFYEELNAVIQKEPLELLDAETRGLFASIGIEKGKPFAPDARMKRILSDAVAIGNATARSIVWHPRTDGTMKGIEIYPGQNSAWQMAYLDKNVFFNGKDGKTMNSDARVMFHYPYTAVTPAMAVTIPGKGSDYGMAYVDSKKQPFDGSKTYKLNIPANPPVNNFWSVVLYDSQTRSLLRTGQRFPALDSLSGTFKKNADGSVDIYMGPKAPKGMESNWLETVPGKSWFAILRMYGPLEPWINKTWKPSEIELVDDTRVEAQAEVNQGIPEPILTPDQVDTSIGTLKFLDGAPYPETAEKVYDYLDRMRGVDAFLKGIPGASVHMLIQAGQRLGAEECHQALIFDKMMDSNPLYLTANTSTMYVVPDLDLLRDGPTVIDAPAGALGAFNDAWFRYLGDVGPFGPDKGKGGKYLVLPPGYEGDVPEGYFVVRSTSHDVWIFMRFSTANGVEAAVKNAKEGLRVYPLAKKDNPPEMQFISGSRKSFNSIHANNFKFYEEINAVIQKEPLELLDAETRGLFASIGIEKGKPFAPDARMKRILTDAVAIGNATARSIVWYPRTEGTMKGVEVFPGQNSAWIMPFSGKNVFFNGQDGQTMNSDARVMFHYPYTAVTPAMAVTIPGKGSDYGFAYVDSKKQPFDGSKTYKLNVPPKPPVNDFWSATVYDSQTRSLLQTSQPFPALDSQGGKFKKNADGSVDIYFGPKAPEGMESNWLETVPGKSFFIGFRMYGPLEPWINKTWKPGEVELIQEAKTIPVTAENFAQAETAWNFSNWARLGSDKKLFHFRDVSPTGPDAPTVRMNWDTLYSMRIVKVADDRKFTVHLPETDLYMSAQIIDGDGFTPYLLIEKGKDHEVKVNTDYAFVGVRTEIVDRKSQESLKKAHALQDKIKITGFMDAGYEPPAFDQKQLAELRKRYKQEFLDKGIDFTYAKGPGRADQHILNLSHAAGWGGMEPELHVSNTYRSSQTMSGNVPRFITFEDPKNKFFTSFTLYDADGYLIDGETHINSSMWKPNDDGTITIHFNAGEDAVNNLSSGGKPFNYLIRSYGVSQKVLDGEWRPLKPELVKEN